MAVEPNVHFRYMNSSRFSDFVVDSHEILLTRRCRENCGPSSPRRKNILLLDLGHPQGWHSNGKIAESGRGKRRIFSTKWKIIA